MAAIVHAMRPSEKTASAESQRFDGLSAALLDWYSGHARELPWRIGPGERARGAAPDPYRVWLAEIMLQQTTVPHATRYYLDFTARWPTIDALAAAEDETVMAAWAGLGYYARARNLLKCARAVSELGEWPSTEEGLRDLPGIGAYTAGAVAALAFGRRAAAIDGNVDRVFARLMAAKGDWKSEKIEIAKQVRVLVPEDRPAEFAEALMDLGATICTPKSPNCLLCPVRGWCTAQAEGNPQRYPIKPVRKAKPVRYGEVYIVSRGGEVLTERRPDRGLLGGMRGLPTSEWTETGPADRLQWVPVAAETLGQVRHVFTHFELRLDVVCGDVVSPPPGYDWTARSDAADALPSVFKKALKLAR
ncbi:MAG: A/G-specific adenine glycosylase [Henriciella sp.]|uniref:A/G-specific adenine glycosylase n=1 Tax=Henriciella sp. TaxID=1968823 RepID=UPI003C78628B